MFQDKEGTLTGRKEGRKEGRGPGMEGASVAPAAFGPASSAFSPLPASSPLRPRAVPKEAGVWAGGGRERQSAHAWTAASPTGSFARRLVGGGPASSMRSERAPGLRYSAAWGPGARFSASVPPGLLGGRFCRQRDSLICALHAGRAGVADAGVAPLGAADKRAGEGAGAAPPAPEELFRARPRA